MITEVEGIDICVLWRLGDNHTQIFFCSRDICYDTCPHFGRGRSHSNDFGKLDQSKLVGELPTK